MLSMSGCKFLLKTANYSRVFSFSFFMRYDVKNLREKNYFFYRVLLVSVAGDKEFFHLLLLSAVDRGEDVPTFAPSMKRP